MIKGNPNRVLFINTKEDVLMLVEIKTNKPRTFISVYRFLRKDWDWAFIRQIEINAIKKSALEPKIITVIGWAIFNNIIGSNDYISIVAYNALLKNYKNEFLSGIIEDNTWHVKQWNRPKKKKVA